MMSLTHRLKRFRSFATCPVRGTTYKRLSASEVAYCEQFIERHGHLTYSEFNVALNEHWLDKPDTRPANWAQMWSLLSEANGYLFSPKRRGAANDR